MDHEKMLIKLEGLHTAETVAETLGMKRQSAINLLSRLKKQGFVTTSGGPKKHLYKITPYKQLPRQMGMFDLLNKHNPNFQINHWYDHQVHGTYTVEDAILDAIDTQNFRAILATMRLFNAITNWPYLYNEAKKRGTWQKVGALYDVARLHMRVRRMPIVYAPHASAWFSLTQLRDRGNFPLIQEKWKVHIPFNVHDIGQVKMG